MTYKAIILPPIIAYADWHDSFSLANDAGIQIHFVDGEAVCDFDGYEKAVELLLDEACFL